MRALRCLSARFCVVGLVLSIAFIAPAEAHDFWIAPNQFWIEPETPAPFTLQVGHGGDRQRSQIAMSRIVRFEARTPEGGTTDLRAALALGAGENDGRIEFAAPGVYVIWLETDNTARSALPSVRFNEYLASEGLTPAILERERRGETGADGVESYRRVAKAIVFVGSYDGRSNGAVLTAIGLPLEIVFEQDPFASTREASLNVRVYYLGRPLQGALIKLNDLDHDAAPIETEISDADGRAQFAPRLSGQWQFNVIWTSPLPEGSGVDFDTIFSSLSFGFPGR